MGVSYRFPPFWNSAQEKKYRRKTPKQLAQEAIFDAIWASGFVWAKLNGMTMWWGFPQPNMIKMDNISIHLNDLQLVGEKSRGRIGAVKWWASLRWCQSLRDVSIIVLFACDQPFPWTNDVECMGTHLPFVATLEIHAINLDTDDDRCTHIVILWDRPIQNLILPSCCPSGSNLVPALI